MTSKYTMISSGSMVKCLICVAITSSIGSPTYELSKHLTTLLTPLLRNKYFIKNSVEFATTYSKFYEFINIYSLMKVEVTTKTLKILRTYIHFKVSVKHVNNFL